MPGENERPVGWSYRDRQDWDPERGHAVQVRLVSGEVMLELGLMRNFGSMAADAWASLTFNEARELADDLWRLASARPASEETR